MFSDETLAFFPDHILIQAPGRLSSVRYEDLELSYRVGETQLPAYKTPTGATVLSTTWEHVRKDGAPDQRYKDNEQIKTVRCAYLSLGQAEEFRIVARATDGDVASYAYKELEAYRQHRQEVETPAAAVSYEMARAPSLLAKAFAAAIATLALTVTAALRAGDPTTTAVAPNDANTPLAARNDQDPQPAGNNRAAPRDKYIRQDVTSRCGSSGALVAARTLRRWSEYTCESVATAGSRWENCLPRHVYTENSGAGCPGAERCCPPRPSERETNLEARMQQGAKLEHGASTTDVHAPSLSCESWSKLTGPFCIANSLDDVEARCKNVQGIWSATGGAPSCQLPGDRLFTFLGSGGGALVKIIVSVPRDPESSARDVFSRRVTELTGVQATSHGGAAVWRVGDVTITLGNNDGEHLIVERAR